MAKPEHREEDAEAIEAPADEPEPERIPATEAEAAELARQADVVAAVEKAHADELPKLGGDLLEPGLGR